MVAGPVWAGCDLVSSHTVTTCYADGSNCESTTTYYYACSGGGADYGEEDWDTWNPDGDGGGTGTIEETEPVPYPRFSLDFIKDSDPNRVELWVSKISDVDRFELWKGTSLIDETFGEMLTNFSSYEGRRNLTLTVRGCSNSTGACSDQTLSSSGSDKRKRYAEGRRLAYISEGGAIHEGYYDDDFVLSYTEVSWTISRIGTPNGRIYHQLSDRMLSWNDPSPEVSISANYAVRHWATGEQVILGYKCYPATLSAAYQDVRCFELADFAHGVYSGAVSTIPSVLIWTGGGWYSRLTDWKLGEESLP